MEYEHTHLQKSSWLEDIEAEEKAKIDAQTLESLLVLDERKFMIKHGGELVSY